MIRVIHQKIFLTIFKFMTCEINPQACEIPSQRNLLIHTREFLYEILAPDYTPLLFIQVSSHLFRAQSTLTDVLYSEPMACMSMMTERRVCWKF